MVIFPRFSHNDWYKKRGKVTSSRSTPTLPLVYGVGHGHHIVFRIAHAEGYPTLMPQTHRYDGVRFLSRPTVVKGDPYALTVGGRDCLCLTAARRYGTFHRTGRGTARRQRRQSTGCFRLFVRDGPSVRGGGGKPINVARTPADRSNGVDQI